jgi:ribose-phosphate pyrophosphokinase
VENIVTFDAHDPRVHNAVPLMGFDNVVPSYQLLKKMFSAFPDIDLKNFMVISPDAGALHRNEYYASTLGVEMGMFSKRRDYAVIKDGRNPIVAHDYLGGTVENKDLFIADDIIASGESVLNIAKELKSRKAKRIFAYATYALFTSGLEEYDRAYEQGFISGVFGTNLTYRSPELLSRPWFYEVDVSKYISHFISALSHDISISKIISPYDKIQELLRKREI